MSEPASTPPGKSPGENFLGNARPAACEGCPANRVARGWVPPTGPRDATMVLVGQGPGADEAAVGEPFVGNSGRTLDRWLVRARVPRERLAVGNVVQCQLPKNRPPHKREAQHCWHAHVRPWLASLPELRVVVPVGVPAMQVLMGDAASAAIAGTVHAMPAEFPAEPYPDPAEPSARVELHEGETIHTEIGPLVVGGQYRRPAITRVAVPVLHPAFIVRGQWALEPAQVRYLRRAWGLANATADSLPRAVVDVREPPPNANPTPTFDDLLEFVVGTRRLADQRLAADIEGTGGRIIGVGFCRLADEHAVYVPFLDAEAPYWRSDEWPMVETLVRELLAFPLVMHNGQAFDVPFLESCGWEVPNYVDDTMIRHHILYTEMPKSLEELAILYLGFPSWKWLSKVEAGDAK